MCWKSKSLPERKVAESDIKVYKILRDVMGSVCSPIFSYTWKIGVLESEQLDLPKFEIEQFGDFWVIDGFGFHSLLEKPRLINQSWYTKSGELLFSYCRGDGECLYECVIPAGSEYYENEHGEIASNKLIITGKSD